MMRTRSALLATAPLALALALPGCGRHQAQTGQAYQAETLPPLPASLPLSPEPPRGPVGTAPGVAALPAAPPLAFGVVPPDEDYAWIDRADLLFDTIGDAPPDYGFTYGGVEPWAWETTQGYELIAEPIEDGYRYYYYEPGADAPFLVRDPDYSYGYGDGRLVAVYAGGRLLARAEAERQAEAAARYWARARALRRADRAIARHPVSAMLWAHRRPQVARAREQWAQARAQDPQWRRWRARQPDGPALARLRAERALRAGAAERFASWQRHGFGGQAPRLYPAKAVRHSAEPIMRPERLTLFGAPRPRRQEAAAPVLRLPHVQAAPAAGRRGEFAQARVRPAEVRPANRPAARVAFRNAAPAMRAEVRRPAFAGPRARPAVAGPRARQERIAGFQHPPRAARAEPRRQAAFTPRPARAPQRAAPMPVRRERAFIPRPAPAPMRMAPVHARAQPHFAPMPARQQARVQFHAPPPHAAPPAPHGGGVPHGGPPPQAARRGGGGGHGHDHGHGH